MPFPLLLPVRLRRSQQCERCELRYPKAEKRCPHCADLNEKQLAMLREKYKREHTGNARLGHWFLLAALGLGILLLLALS
jgi:hypothetical protein